MTDQKHSIILGPMPRSWERRTIDYFISQYNLQSEPKIIRRNASLAQESPDAICELADGRIIALELTSVYPPKGSTRRRNQQHLSDSSPIRRIVKRKLNNDYKIAGSDEVWLVVQVRNTLPPEVVKSALADCQLQKFDRLWVFWPMQLGERRVCNTIYSLPNGSLQIMEKAS